MAPNSRQGATRGVKYTDPPFHEHNERPATTAVLNTNGLLTQILSDVPLEKRVDLRRVCKIWSSIIISKAGFQANPIEVCCWCTRSRFICSQLSQDTRTPHYSPDIAFKIHSARVCDHGEYGKLVRKHWAGSSQTIENEISIDKNAIDINVCVDIESVRNVTKLIQHGAEFITKPPITRALLRSCLDSDNEYPRELLTSYATLSISEGIRVRDLLHTLTQMRASLARTLIKPPTARNGGQTMAFFVLCRHEDGDEDT